MAGVNSAPIVATLLDPLRLMVAGSLAGRRRTVDDVVDHTGADPDEVAAAIDVLLERGIIDAAADGYSLPQTTVERLAGEPTDA